MSRLKVLKSFIISLIFTSINICIIKEDIWLGWFGLMFFGTLNILFLIKFINPKFKGIKDTDTNGLKKTEDDFLVLYNDIGIFNYTHNGFVVMTEKGNKSIDWEQINTFIGFKRDYFTTDCICLFIYINDGQTLEITEDTKGWFQFLEHSKMAFPTIDQSWEIKISTPAFKTTTTVLFDRENRSLEEIIK